MFVTQPSAFAKPNPASPAANTTGTFASAGPKAPPPVTETRSTGCEEAEASARTFTGIFSSTGAGVGPTSPSSQVMILVPVQLPAGSASRPSGKVSRTIAPGVLGAAPVL